MTTTTNDVEIYRMLVGQTGEVFWTAYKTGHASGTPASVAFDAGEVLRREEALGNVVGFYHTHPGFNAYPSPRDDRTMGAWVNAFGRPLVCLIEGVDGLRGFIYTDDETGPAECMVEEFKKQSVWSCYVPRDAEIEGGLLVGTLGGVVAECDFDEEFSEMAEERHGE